MEESENNNNNKGEELVDLPPGFRFHPTDEEIITYYLTEKVMNNEFSAVAIGEADLNKCEPWDLHEKAKMGENEWYFFCQKDRKYPTGMRTNRATESGYWKATGKDKEIFRGKGFLVGMKKTLVFYKGRAPKGEKTNWVMHEFRLEGNLPFPNLNRFAKDEWVVCRIHHKPLGSAKKNPIDEHMTMNSFDKNIGPFFEFSSLPPLIDPSSSSGQPGPSFSAGDPPEFKYTTAAQTLPPPPQIATANQYFRAPVNYRNPQTLNYQNPQTPNRQNPSKVGVSLLNGSAIGEMGTKVEPMSSTQSGLSVDVNFYSNMADVSSGHRNVFIGSSKSYEDFADFLGNFWDS